MWLPHAESIAHFPLMLEKSGQFNFSLIPLNISSFPLQNLLYQVSAELDAVIEVLSAGSVETYKVRKWKVNYWDPLMRDILQVS